jgi:ligand-binding SRPBCC domain-containing protein
MADHVMESRLWLARRRPDVFAFVADPANLPRLMPPSLSVRVLTPGVRMEAGAVLDFRIAWLGVPMRWRMFVREWDPPYRFVDVQVRGPYARWEHRHRFLEEGDGTWIEDRLTYRLPAGALGRAAHTLLAARRLRAAWTYRREQLIALLAPLSARAD